MLNNKGFTLLEVIISMFILSVGLMAVAAMQTTAMTASTSSKNTTIGVQMAEEMIDRIRVNASDAPGIYNNIDTTSNCAGLVDPALGDCNQWLARLAGSGLPNASGTVTVQTDTPIPKAVTVRVKVQWGIGATRSITFTTMLEAWIA